MRLAVQWSPASNQPPLNEKELLPYKLKGHGSLAGQTFLSSPSGKAITQAGVPPNRSSRNEDSAFGAPEESIDLAKRRRIVRAARHYLSTIPAASWREARFDVIAIEGHGEGAVMRHYPGAFDAKGKIL